MEGSGDRQKPHLTAFVHIYFPVTFTEQYQVPRRSHQQKTNGVLASFGTGCPLAGANNRSRGFTPTHEHTHREREREIGREYTLGTCVASVFGENCLNKILSCPVLAPSFCPSMRLVSVEQDFHSDVDGRRGRRGAMYQFFLSFWPEK